MHPGEAGLRPDLGLCPTKVLLSFQKHELEERVLRFMFYLAQLFTSACSYLNPLLHGFLRDKIAGYT